MQVVVRELHEVLRKLELDSLSGVAKFSGQAIQRGSQEVFALRVFVDGAKHTLFLKRVHLSKFKLHRIIPMLLRGGVVSRVRREWDNYLSLQGTPILTARPIAFGEDCGLLAERFSYIITGAAPGIALDVFFKSERDLRRRRKVQRALGLWTRKLHDSGISFPDLYARHIFVDQADSEPTFSLIDVVRVRRHKNVSLASRARDLAALTASLPQHDVSLRERMRFAKAYGFRDFPGLQNRVDRRVHVLANRGRFEELSPIGVLTCATVLFTWAALDGIC